MEFVFSRSIRKIRANFLPFLIPIISSGFAPILFSLLHCLRKNTFAYFSLASSAFLCNQLRPLFHEIEISHPALYAVVYVWYVMRQPWIIEQMRKQPLAGWVGLFTFFLSCTLSVDPVPTKDFFLVSIFKSFCRNDVFRANERNPLEFMESWHHGKSEPCRVPWRRLSKWLHFHVKSKCVRRSNCFYGLSRKQGHGRGTICNLIDSQWNSNSPLAGAPHALPKKFTSEKRESITKW